jgi:hypothetical protein
MAAGHSFTIRNDRLRRYPGPLGPVELVAVSLLKAVLCGVHGQVPLAVLLGRPNGIEGDRHVLLADPKKPANRDDERIDLAILADQTSLISPILASEGS